MLKRLSTLKLTIVIMVVLILTGCGDEVRQPVDLEQRVTRLEKQVEILQHQMMEQTLRNELPSSRSIESIGKNVNRVTPISPKDIEEHQRIRAEVRKRLEERRENARNKKNETANMSKTSGDELK